MIEFEQYRSLLRSELTTLSKYSKLLRRLQERTKDRLEEMNMAPGFFQITKSALFDALVVCFSRIFDPKSQRGWFDYLKYIEGRIQLFDINELQKRRGYPDGHWVLKNRTPITLQSIESHRIHIKQITPAFEKIKKWRDKHIGHLDKTHFGERGTSTKEFPIKWAEIENALKLSHEIFNEYSVAYDGNSFVLEPINCKDVDAVLDSLHEWREQLKAKLTKRERPQRSN